MKRICSSLVSPFHAPCFVQEVTPAGVYVRSISVEGDVYGVASSCDLIAVCVQGAAKHIYLIDVISGDPIRSFGELGSDEGQLFGCSGIRFHLDGDHILVVERNNSRLSLFTVNGEFLRCMGVGILRNPFDVDFASNGDIVVADWGNHRISVLSPDGSTLLRTCYTVREEAPGKLPYPTALAMHCEQLYVMDEYSGRVLVLM